MSNVTGIAHQDPYARFDEILRRGHTAVEKKLNAREEAPQVANTVPAATDIDQAYGFAMNGLSNSDEALAQHSLDADRVAQLLDL